MSKAYWLIQGYHSFTLIFEQKVHARYLTDEQMQSLLKALVAKAALTYDEIVGAYARRRSSIANDHLIVRRDAQHNLTCGSNPHFIARLRRENDAPS
jgi:hypothetical protein